MPLATQANVNAQFAAMQANMNVQFAALQAQLAVIGVPAISGAAANVQAIIAARAENNHDRRGIRRGSACRRHAAAQLARGL